MSNVSFLRHGAFFGPEDAQDIVFNIIGVGATGSWAGLLAAKMGWHKFCIWDADIVESHNCSNQIYDLSHVGTKKVDAFEEVLKRFNPDIQIEKHDYFFTSELHADHLEDAVFVAVDTLSARKDILECAKGNVLIDILFETKIGFNHAELNSIDPSNEILLDKWISLLKTDEEVQESPCNERIITTLVAIVASNLAHLLCAYYSSARKTETFKTNSKTIFTLTNNLTTYNP